MTCAAQASAVSVKDLVADSAAIELPRYQAGQRGLAGARKPGKPERESLVIATHGVDSW
jgi:hypothetical protein